MQQLYRFIRLPASQGARKKPRFSCEASPGSDTAKVHVKPTHRVLLTDSPRDKRWGSLTVFYETERSIHSRACELNGARVDDYVLIKGAQYPEVIV